MRNNRCIVFLLDETLFTRQSDPALQASNGLKWHLDFSIGAD